MKNQEEQLLTLQVSIYASMILLETHEDLKLTSYYKQSLKNAGNNFIKKLEPHVEDKLKHVYDEDEELCSFLLGSLEKLIKRISKCKPHELVRINDILDEIDAGNLKFIKNEDLKE